MTLTDDHVFEAYRPTDGRRDELLRPDRSVRPAWQEVASVLDQIGHADLQNRRVEIRRLLRGDGVTYNVYGDDSGRPNAWNLDPLPLVWSSDEWRTIEQGIVQRAELLALVLEDIYGPRSLFRKGVLPPDAVLGHPGYLRALVQPGPSRAGAAKADGLVLYGADIVRDLDGYPVVLADFAESPSGAGYALENRLVLSRVMPSLFRSVHVHRTAPFLRMVRASLAARSASVTDDPRVVILTPGPHNESHFEHAFLASQLGYTLVEGGDLVVRRGRVYLQSLGGDEPVDAMIRRVDGEWCDPLELRPESQLGVPGLVEATRRGSLAVANHLGASVLECPALTAFLPQLSHALLGQPLLLPQPRSWWCGDPQALAHVLAHIDDMVVKPSTPWKGSRTLRSRQLDDADRAALLHDIAECPHLFVGQEIVEPSTAPTLNARGVIEARPVVVRTFAVADHDSFVVMPGGLGRVGGSLDEVFVSNQRGALSKDVWVLASEPEPTSGFWLRSGPSVSASDPAGALPPRTVENLYWLGRYVERAEGLVRLLRTVVDRHIELQDRLTPGASGTMERLLAAVTHTTGTYPGFVDRPDQGSDPLPELLRVIVDPDVPGSLAATLNSMLASADAVREQLSGDSWLALDSLTRTIAPLRGAPVAEAENLLASALASALVNLLAFAGLAGESMVRDPGWAAMDVGRRIERTIQLLALLRATLTQGGDTAAESLTIESTLVAAESIITYRRRYRSQAQVATVLDLLLLDPDNPRSAGFQLAAIESGLAALPRSRAGRTGLDADERVAVEAHAKLRIVDTRELATRHEMLDGSPPSRLVMATTIDELRGLMVDLSDAIEKVHFTHLQRSPLLLHLTEGSGV